MTQQAEQPTTIASESEQAPTHHDPEPAEAMAIDALAATNLAAIRDLVLRAHPAVVPELITGGTVDDLIASIEPAEAAYRRVSESLRTSTIASSPTTPSVPAGGERPMPIDPDRLPASEKIRRGLAQSRD